MAAKKRQVALVRDVTLPSKPSELIRLALKDLAKCRRDKRYVIDMFDWHHANSHCAVCLAGAVMAQTCKVPPDSTVISVSYCSFFSIQQQNAFRALDHFRCGHVSAGLCALEIQAALPLKLRAMTVTRYEESPAGFRRDMQKMARGLAKHGL